jgi:hypothetical protein
MKLSITEFKKGVVFITDITKLEMERNFRRYLVFKKLEELFEEITTNSNMEITDENGLLIPI